MDMNNIMTVIDNDRLLYYQPLPETRPDGVCATLIGYQRDGVDYWY